MNRKGSLGMRMAHARRISRNATAVEFSKFVATRGAGALLSILVYWLLLPVMRYEAAYAIAFVLGIAIAYVTNAMLVFNQPMHPRSALGFPLVYLAQFFLMGATLKILVEHFGAGEGWAIVLASALWLPVTFLASRWVLRWR